MTAMKSTIALLIITTLSLYSCKSGNSQHTVDRDNFQYPNWYEAAMPAEWEDNDSLNTARTADNTIYIPHRVFRYDYSLVHKGNPNKPLYAVVFFNDSCLVKKVDCMDWSIDSVLDFSSIKRYPIEYLELLVYKTRGRMSLADEQTIIRYDQFNRKGKVLFGGLTGVKEDSNAIFLHPPRFHAFGLTEFCAFPWYNKHKNEWPGEIHIPSYWAEDAKMGDVDLSSLSLYYTKQGKEEISTPRGTRLCEKVVATAENENLQTQLTYWYDEELGFVQMDYVLPKGYLMTLKLVEVRDDSTAK